ncbi:iron-containing alcohol dehydrogenase family protein [Actibacterium sp. MT2.3-13A]|uniref:iron-containing alcohol dehydrogenase family protein n=1 Tax=Actibacterium sp. MT2.3-13A TaxID=2828332 RepID=UPI001BAB0441|nr:iron-containing alcohol dehydrogenase family protein [Actibacterium sp. MT2.3-13A]
MTTRRFDGTAIPKTIVSGPGCRSEISAELDRMKVNRVAIVSSTSLAARTPFLRELTETLGSRVVAVIDRVESNLPVQSVRMAVETMKREKPEAIIAIGGGIVHDMAKAIAVMLPSGRDIVEFVSRFEPPDTFHGIEIDIEPLPVLTMPSTFSAADVVAGGAVTDTERGEKLIFVHPKLTPAAVFLDAEVVASTPTRILAASGMNAIHHCLEASYSKGAQPITDAFAFAALRSLLAVLPEFSDAGSPPALDRVQTAIDAASMSGLTYANSWLGIGHSVCHSLGGRYNLSHSEANSVMVLQSLRFNFEAARPKLAEAARAAGVSVSPDDKAAAEALVAAVEAVSDAIGTPKRLSEIGLPPGQSARIAEDVLGDPQTYWNPRPATADEIISWLDAAW